MAKKIATATIAVFVLWFVLDFIIHGVVLKGAYQATAHLWRPEHEMKLWLIDVVTLLTALVFTGMYASFVSPKSARRGFWFGFLFGVTSGLGMGYGSFAVMPIPYFLALTWFLGSLLECTLAGLIVGYIVKE